MTNLQKIRSLLQELHATTTEEPELVDNEYLSEEHIVNGVTIRLLSNPEQDTTIL